MDKEKFLVFLVGVGGFIILSGTYLIGFYHGAKVEKEKLIQDILNYQRQIANYKRKIIEKEEKIKQLEVKTKKIINLTQKVSEVIEKLPEEIPSEDKSHNRDSNSKLPLTQTEEDLILKEKKTQDGNIDKIFIMDSESDEAFAKKVLLDENKGSSSLSKQRTSQSEQNNVKEKKQLYWTIQLGAFLKYNQAKKLAKEIETKLKSKYSIFIRKENNYYKVFLGKFKTKSEAKSVYEDLKRKKISGFIRKISED